MNATAHSIVRAAAIAAVSLASVHIGYTQVAPAPPPASSPSAPRSRGPGSDLRVRDLLARLERTEPSLNDVRAAALRHARLDGRTERSWARRARLAGALPVLTLRAASGTGSDRELSRSSTGTERLDLGHDRDLDIEARAVWQLDRLVFDDVEIRILQTAQRSYQERVQLLSRVTSVYFQRRKLLLAAYLTPSIGTGAGAYKAALKGLAIAETTGQLDALTGGYFSAELSRRLSR